jgi:hypothetical protein
MDRYYDTDPSNRRYSEQELQQVRERYLVKPTEAEGGSRSGERRLGSAWRAAMLSLLSKKLCLAEEEVSTMRTRLLRKTKKAKREG